MSKTNRNRTFFDLDSCSVAIFGLKLDAHLFLFIDSRYGNYQHACRTQFLVRMRLTFCHGHTTTREQHECMWSAGAKALLGIYSKNRVNDSKYSYNRSRIHT